MVNTTDWDNLSQKEREKILNAQGKPYNYQPQAWEKAMWTKNITKDEKKIDTRYKGGAGPGDIPI